MALIPGIQGGKGKTAQQIAAEQELESIRAKKAQTAASDGDTVEAGLPVVGRLLGAGIGAFFGDPMSGMTLGGKIGDMAGKVGAMAVDPGRQNPANAANLTTSGLNLVVGQKVGEDEEEEDDKPLIPGIGGK
jgi:uncharacterized membrane protein